MPMLRMRHSKDEVNDLGSSALPFHDSLGWVGMRAQSVGTAARGITLAENAGSVRKGISDWGPELPKDLAHILLEVLIDFYVLVVTEVFMWQV